MPFEEAQLIRQIAARDRCALKTLYEIYFPRLAAFFTHMSTPVEIAINDTLFDVWRESGAARLTESAYVWIMRIALRHARLHATDAGAIALLANLNIEQRAVMHLVYTGRTREEVGEILELPRGGVDALLSEARAAV